MTERSVTHATFVVERTYDASPARVFAAWATPEAKARWFGPDEETGEYELDFQVGGREVNRGSGPDGDVYTYDMLRDETRISVSLATVELRAEGVGTRLTFTEQGAFLDGQDTPDLREQGTGSLLDALAADLQREPATAY